MENEDSTRLFMINSAMGLRQILPWHTNSSFTISHNSFFNSRKPRRGGDLRLHYSKAPGERQGQGFPEILQDAACFLQEEVVDCTK